MFYRAWRGLSLVYTCDASISISTSISARMFTRAISISIRWHTVRKRRSIKSLGNRAESGGKWQRMSNLNVRWQLVTVFQFPFLALVLMLASSRYLQARRNDASTSTSTREWKWFHSLVLMLASLRRTCKPDRRNHKHKRKHKALMLALHRFNYT